MHSWLCVGRVQQIANPGDYLALTLADEPILVVRGATARSAPCRRSAVTAGTC